MDTERLGRLILGTVLSAGFVVIADQTASAISCSATCGNGAIITCECTDGSCEAWQSAWFACGGHAGCDYNCAIGGSGRLCCSS